MTTSIPYSWLKQLPVSALEGGESYPFGTPPPFPWEQFSAIFAKVFQLESIKIEPSNWQLRQADDLFTQLGSHQVALHCDAGPLNGTFWFVMAENEREQLMSLMLTNKFDGEVIDPEYQKAFIQFLALELFSIASKLDYQKDLTPHILDDDSLPTEDSYCQDISLKISDRTFVVRLIVNDDLRNAWKERFSDRNLTLSLPREMAEKIKVTLHLEGASTALKLSEWKQVSEGDFLLLDRSTLKFAEDQGTVMITLLNQPLFLGQVKDGNVKILDYPLYNEAPTTMVTNDEDDLDEFDIDDNHTFSDDLTDLSDDDTTLHDDTTALHDTTLSDSVGSKTVENTLRDTTIDETDTTISRSVKKPASFAPSPEKPINANEIPVSVVIEVGRIEMTIQKLIELQPGSMLDLNIHPEDGVDLTINGQIVAKGELLKIGDTLGVRILDKG